MIVDFQIATILTGFYPTRPPLPILPPAVCQYLNACIPRAATSDTSAEKKTSGKLESTDLSNRSKTKKLIRREVSARRENSIRVVQLTDIHVESNYKEVR